MLHCDRKLFLVFEYLDFDLKKFMDKSAPNGIPHDHVKVNILGSNVREIMDLTAFVFVNLETEY